MSNGYCEACGGMTVVDGECMTHFDEPTPEERAAQAAQYQALTASVDASVDASGRTLADRIAIARAELQARLAR